jgi:hypothetical protein
VAEFTIEITGQNRDQLALELSVPLSSSQGNVQVSTEYSEEDQHPLSTVTTVSVVTSASQDDLQVAESIWNWWQSRHLTGNKVTIRTAKGSVIDLSLIDQKQLEIALTQETAMAGTTGTIVGGGTGPIVGATAGGVVGWGVGMIAGGLIGLVAGVFLGLAIAKSNSSQE